MIKYKNINPIIVQKKSVKKGPLTKKIGKRDIIIFTIKSKYELFDVNINNDFIIITYINRY